MFRDAMNNNDEGTIPAGAVPFEAHHPEARCGGAGLAGCVDGHTSRMATPQVDSD
jgi:hypothetical protein